MEKKLLSILFLGFLFFLNPLDGFGQCTPPTVSISSTPTTICSNGAVSFTISGTPDAIVTYTINGATPTTVSIPSSGQYTFGLNINTTTTIRLTEARRSTCTSWTTLNISATATVNPPVVVDAGIPQTVCAGGSITLAGSITGGTTSGTWTAPSGTFSSAGSLTSTYTPSIASGTVTLTLTSAVPAGACPYVSNTVIITVNPATVVNAGIPQTVCAGGTITLAGIVTGAATTGTWSAPSGTFSNAGSLTSTYTPSIASGTVTLTLTSADSDGAGPCIPVTNTVVITVNPITVVNPGPPQTVCAGGTITLAGSVSGGATTGAWTAPSGTFSNPGALTSTYTPGIATGTVTLTLTSADPAGPCPSISETVVITVNPATVVNAGTPQTVCAGGTITLAGSITGGTNSGTWSAPSGTFSNAGSLTSTYTPSIASGTVTLTLTSADSDGAGPCIPVTNTVVITVNPATVVNAGTPQTVCAGGTITLAGSITGGATTGTWSASSGTFSNAGSLTSTYTPGIPSGTVTLTLTSADSDGAGPCLPVTNTVVITVNPATVVNAGTPQTVCAGGTITLAGSITGATTAGTWSAPSGTFSNAGSLTSNYTPGIASGTVTLTLTSADSDGTGPCIPVTNTVVITVNPATVVNAGNPQTICAGGTITLAGSVSGGATTGTWSAPSGTFSNVGSLTSTYTPGIASGTVTLTLTSAESDGAGPCIPVTDTVDITVTAPVITIIAPANVTVSTELNSCTATIASLGTPVTNSNCGVKSITNNAPSVFPIGETIVTWTVTDNSNNTATSTQTVTVTDNQKPTILAPSDVTVNTDPDKCTASNVILGIPTINDNCGVPVASNNAPTEFPVGTTTVIWTVTDNSNNTQTVTQTVRVNDKQAPSITSLPDVVGECPVTVIPPTVIDNCGDTITGTTGTTNLTFYESGTIYWTFKDVAGNSTGVIEQKVIISDNTAPVPTITNLPPKTITGCVISSISELNIPTATDACEGLIYGTLSESFGFPFSSPGSRTIVWEFTDSHDNKSFQEQEITFNPVTVSGGILKGRYQSIVFENQLDITSCGETISVIMELTGQQGTIVHWEKFAVNRGVWEVIADYDNSHTATFPVGALESTKYRVLIQTGTCSKYSNDFYIRALPTGAAPTVKNMDNNNPENQYCVGGQVNLIATSNYLAPQEAIPNSSGDFNQGQLNSNDPKSWLIDGEIGGFSCGGNSTEPRNWSCTNDGKTFGNIEYNSMDTGNNAAFAIAYGDFNSTKYNGKKPTTLETPILNLSNAQSASLDFDQAFNFVQGDKAIIEISFDGGMTYELLKVIHAQGDPAKTWLTAGTAQSTAGSNATKYNFNADNTSISLASILDRRDVSKVRIRWSFTGTSNQSVWAMDNIYVNKQVFVTTDIVWTEGIGKPNENPLATGKTDVQYSFTANIPGVHKYGGTALINGCRTYSEEGTGLITIKVSSAYAGVDITNAECGQNVVQLNAYDNTLSANQNIAKGSFNPPPPGCKTCDAPGTGDIGTWTAVRQGTPLPCTTDPVFSDPKDPNAIFTAGPGTYILTWTVNGCSDDVTVTITDCTQIDFDGKDDYVDFSNKYNLTGAFSLEVWVKPVSIQGTQTILSKRDANNTGPNAKGYDLSLKNGEVTFNWDNSGSITSNPYKINSDRWYHISLTHSESNEYKLYIDGVLLKTAGGGSPGGNSLKALLGAMDKNGSLIPTNYFKGWMEELRIWNVALTQDQLHRMMNQRIKKDGANVLGEVIPLNIPNLNWDNLVGYYRMDNIGCGNIYGFENVGFEGKLRNITSSLNRSAPLPYTSKADGTWAARETWTQPVLWDFPNSKGIDGITPIDWNIVRTTNNITSGGKDIKVLGLISQSGKLSIMSPTGAQNEYNPGQSLHVTHYLKLDGVIDLEGESQLLQDQGSILDEASVGYLDRDQQGKMNSFVYNYWSSPVSTQKSNNNGGYTVSSVLKDGTTYNSTRDINFQDYHGAADGDRTSPITISTYWLWGYSPAAANVYAEWDHIRAGGSLISGEGFTMKGTAGKNIGIDAMQNYTFRGKPHNGDIPLKTMAGNQNYLIGNPYPSAIDANLLIQEFGTGTKAVFDGALYFWDHFVVVNHILKDYIGGYATYNLIGGIESAQSSDDRINNNMTRSSKRPDRYIPVGQGFLVNSTNPVSDAGLGGDIIFKNSHRIYKRESVDNSIFLKPETVEKTAKSTESEFKKIRVSFSSPVGYWRQILVGAVPGTTDGFDLGYDAHLFDDNLEDMYWVQGNNNLVIQGVNDFNKDRVLPLGVKIKEEKPFTIRIDTVENADKNLRIYLHDKAKDSIHDLRKEHYVSISKPGTFNSRFEIIFYKDEPVPPVVELPTDPDEIFEEFGILIRHGRTDRELQILNPDERVISNMYIFDLNGNKLEGNSGLPGGKEFRMPVANYSSGVYIVQLVVDGRVVSKKIIINN